MLTVLFFAWGLYLTFTHTLTWIIGANSGFSILPKDMPTCRSEELAIKPPIFRLVDDLFYLLSHNHPLSHPVSPSWQIRWVLSKLPVFSINFPPLCCCSYSAARQETFTETQKRDVCSKNVTSEGSSLHMTNSDCKSCQGSRLFYFIDVPTCTS